MRTATGNLGTNGAAKSGSTVAFTPLPGTKPTVAISYRGEVRFAGDDDWQTVCDELIAKHGAGVPNVKRIDELAAGVAEELAIGFDREDRKSLTLTVDATPKGFSSFSGALVTDDAAKARIEAQHKALGAGGVKVDTNNQFFATGSRALVGGARLQGSAGSARRASRR